MVVLNTEEVLLNGVNITEGCYSTICYGVIVGQTQRPEYLPFRSFYCGGNVQAYCGPTCTCQCRYLPCTVTHPRSFFDQPRTASSFRRGTWSTAAHCWRSVATTTGRKNRYYTTAEPNYLGCAKYSNCTACTAATEECDWCETDKLCYSGNAFGINGTFRWNFSILLL